MYILSRIKRLVSFINDLGHRNVKKILAAFIKKKEFNELYIQINKLMILIIILSNK